MENVQINAEEIDVEEIMRKVRDNIKRRKESGGYGEAENEAGKGSDEKRENPKTVDELQKDLDYIKSNWDIQNNSYFISSHRRMTGKALVKGRELIHGEVRRYVDPMIWKQREFNGRIATILDEASQSMGEIKRSIDHILAQIDDKITQSQSNLSSEIDDKITQSQSNLSSEIDDKITQSQSNLSSEIGDKISQTQANLSSEIDDKLSQTQSNLSSEIDDKLSQTQSNLSSEIDDKLSQTQSKISSEIDDKLSQTQSKISSEIDDKLSQTQSKISSEIVDKISQTQAKISSEIGDKISQTQAKISSEIGDKISQTQAKISSEIGDKISQTQAKISLEIEDQVRAVIGAMNKDIENKAWLAEILDGRTAKSMEVSLESSDRRDNELNYFIFEERFRGSRADIKGRQLSFQIFFEGCKNVLDIGCGRGEFLEILMEHGIGGRGIDIDEDMVKFCRSKGLAVDRIDAVSYLEKLEDKSLDGIFIDQVVEHLEPEYIIKMLGLCYKKLIYGGNIVAETVNPLSFFSFANFYIDLSHKRPIHPETLKFLLKTVGFRDVEIKLLVPVPNEARLKKIDNSIMRDGNNEAINLYNYNIDMLNNVLFGPQDYALIGKK